MPMEAIKQRSTKAFDLVPSSPLGHLMAVRSYLRQIAPAATGTLRFAPGESSKTISIALDVWDKLLKIILSDNEGNATFVGAIKEATVTVLGKGSAPPK